MERERFDNYEPDYLTLIVKIGEEKREVKFFYLDGLTTEGVEEYDSFVEEQSKAAFKEGAGNAGKFAFNCACLHRLSENITLEEIRKHLTQKTVNALFAKLTARYDEKKSELPA